MTTINPRDIEHIFERLRSGVVPERGLEAFAVGIDRSRFKSGRHRFLAFCLEAFAVGIDRSRDEIGRQLNLAGNNEGVFKVLHGGCDTGGN
jgi:P-loop Domain of unknown function (DUF2791)